jgi:hypothetical protein
MTLPGFTAEYSTETRIQGAGERTLEQTLAGSVVPASCCNVFPPGGGIEVPSSCFDISGDDLGQFVCWLVGLGQGGSVLQPGSCSENPLCSPDPCKTCTNCHSTWIGWCFCNGQNCGWGSPCCG